MGVVRDVTVDNLVTAVGNIDTSSLAQDSTLQDVVTAIGNISGGSDPVTNTTVNSLCKDTTGQSIASALQIIGQNVKPSASNIPYDSSLSVKGKIDEVDEARYQIKSYNSSIPADNMHGNDYSGVYWMNKTTWNEMPSGSYGYLEVVGNLQKFYPYVSSGLADIYVRMYINNTWNAWKRVSSLSDASISRASGVSSNVPIPDIVRQGNVVIIHFAHQFQAGTYYNLYKVSPLPIGNQHAMLDLGGQNRTIIALLSDGTMRFNVSTTLSTTQYVIGQLVYLTDD